jgi:hypothetical protein
MAANQRVDVGDGSNSTVRLHLWDGSLPLDSFRAVQTPATEAVGLGCVKTQKVEARRE